jgi:hypothetical protein
MHFLHLDRVYSKRVPYYDIINDIQFIILYTVYSLLMICTSSLSIPLMGPIRVGVLFTVYRIKIKVLQIPGDPKVRKRWEAAGGFAAAALWLRLSVL